MSSANHLVVTGGTLITPTRVVPNQEIHIHDGRIASIGEPDAGRHAGATVINAAGKFVCPGFIDLHVHGCGADSIWSGTVAGMAREMVRFGTTSFLCTSYYDESLLERITDFPPASAEGAEVLGIYLEGPFISKIKRGAIPVAGCIEPSPASLRRVMTRVGPALKLMTVAPELPGVLEIIAELLRAGVVVAQGHSNATCDESRTAADAGARHATHLFNGMRPLTSRDPGIVGAAMTDDAMSVEIIADGVHLHPATMNLVAHSKPGSQIVLVTDAIGGPESIDGTKVVPRFGPVSVRDGAPRLKDGTIAGSILTMDKAVRNTCIFADVSLQDSIAMATLNPARVLGMDDKKGVLRPSADADIVILNSDFSVHMTIARGRIVYESAQ